MNTTGYYSISLSPTENIVNISKMILIGAIFIFIVIKYKPKGLKLTFLFIGAFLINFIISYLLFDL